MAASVHKDTIATLERGYREPQRDKVQRIIAAFDGFGVEFTHGDQPGMRFKGRSVDGERVAD